MRQPLLEVENRDCQHGRKRAVPPDGSSDAFFGNGENQLTDEREITSTAAAALATRPAAATVYTPIPAIDTHTHFYDPSRPQGVPWPPKGDAVLHRTVLPPEFRTLVAPFNVLGTVIVEASEWREDNQWILDLEKNETAVVGLIGHLVPGQPEFAADLIVRRVSGRIIDDATYYRPGLDVLCDLFGDDRMLDGSNWPVSDKAAPYSNVYRTFLTYFATKDRATAEKYF